MPFYLPVEKPASEWPSIATIVTNKRQTFDADWCTSMIRHSCWLVRRCGEWLQFPAWINEICHVRWRTVIYCGTISGSQTKMMLYYSTMLIVRNNWSANFSRNLNIVPTVLSVDTWKSYVTGCFTRTKTSGAYSSHDGSRGIVTIYLDCRQMIHVFEVDQVIYKSVISSLG